ncbi:MAG: ribosome small subunit-dependent GTPase A [Treponema sp.]|jgi:ribosome biogenesis GTPase|nr:ribosome small subunit-dependent GTPase A [Treponema sp.]
MRGRIIRGSRNVFTVLDENNREIECRIKGKVLKGVDAYNPLAPGDWVEYQGGEGGTGLILGLEDRKNFYSRFNQKGGAPQILAANVDLVFCVTSPSSPPFRPRFLDRAVLQADSAGIEPVVICNKWDITPVPHEAEERLADFSRIGYRVLFVSASTGLGIPELRRLMAGKVSVMVGQSGVGKSSLIRALDPTLPVRIGPLNQKYDRGNHTTCQAQLLALSALNEKNEKGGESGADGFVIDTPGIRRFILDGIEPDELILYMRELSSLAGRCLFGLSCSHTGEKGCRVREALASGALHGDRYESFLRITEELRGGAYE